jgi:hypothetical protein
MRAASSCGGARTTGGPGSFSMSSRVKSPPRRGRLLRSDTRWQRLGAEDRRRPWMMARSMAFPELAHVARPSVGEQGGRRLGDWGRPRGGAGEEGKEAARRAQDVRRARAGAEPRPRATLRRKGGLREAATTRPGSRLVAATRRTSALRVLLADPLELLGLDEAQRLACSAGDLADLEEERSTLRHLDPAGLIHHRAGGAARGRTAACQRVLGQGRAVDDHEGPCQRALQRAASRQDPCRCHSPRRRTGRRHRCPGDDLDCRATAGRSRDQPRDLLGGRTRITSFQTIARRSRTLSTARRIWNGMKGLAGS